MVSVQLQVDSFLPFRGVFSEHHRMGQKMPQWIHALSLFLLQAE
jgi:hypothetical protein